jgi:hypothetical protein
VAAPASSASNRLTGDPRSQTRTWSAMNADRISVKKRKLCDRIGGDSTISRVQANARRESIESAEKMSRSRTAIAAVRPIIAKLNRCRTTSVKSSRVRVSHEADRWAMACPAIRYATA